MGMKTFINFEDIDNMCGKTRGDNDHFEKSSGTSSGYNGSESEQKHDRWTNFKAKAKNIWNKAKNFVSEIISGLIIIKSVLKVSAGVMKEFAKFRQARRAFV